jgi:hypothetical protein
MRFTVHKIKTTIIYIFFLLYDFVYRTLLTLTFLSMEQSRIFNTLGESIFISEDFKKV